MLDTGGRCRFACEVVADLILRRCTMGRCVALCLLGLCAVPRPVLAQKPIVSTATPLWVAPVTAPATLPGIGKEMQRALLVALKEANVPAQPGKTDSEGSLGAKLEEIGSGRLRLSLSYRGSSSHAVGALEHLDDLVYAVVAELRSKLLSSAEPQVPAAGTGPTGSASATRSPSGSKLAALSGVGGSSLTSTTNVSLTGALRVSSSSVAGPRRGDLALVVPESLKREQGALKRDPPSPAGAVGLPPTPSLPPPPAVGVTTPNPAKDAEQKPRPRPRVAIGLMGEPATALPPGYFGLGVVGQQAMMSFLQQRLAVPVVATRLYSLVGGFEALEQSLRVSAHHTLMARLDALAVTGGVLSGRIHLVLLQDGKLLYDRSVALPPTVTSVADSPSVVFGRSLTAALESLSGELSSRLPPQ